MTTDLTTQLRHLDRCQVISGINLLVIADNSFRPTKEQLEFIADELINDNPYLPALYFLKIIKNGLKGKYDGKYQVPINSRTIFTWFRNCHLNKSGEFVERYNGNLYINGKLQQED